MVNCAQCGKKIGFFQTEYIQIDKNGNSIKYCFECNEEYTKRENQKKLNVIKPLIEKYFSECETSKKVAIEGIYCTKKIDPKFKYADLENVKKYFGSSPTLGRFPTT